jgi:glutamine amidotransferase
VRRLPAAPGLKIPHMGWNATRRGPAPPTQALASIPDGTFFYFVHSYYADPARPADVALASDHGTPFCAAIARDNVFACQFHPEKSQSAGLALLRSFVSGTA